MPLAQTWGALVDEAGEAAVPYKPLPAGSYDVKIIASELKKSSGQKDGFNITAEVEGGAFAGKKIYNTFWVSPDSPGAMGIFFRQFATLGLDAAYFRAEPSLEQINKDLVGRRFYATVVEAEYQGTPKNELKKVDPARGNAPVAPLAGTPTATPTPTVVSAPTPAATPTPTVPTAPTGNPWGQAPSAPVPATPAVSDAPATPAAPELPPLSGPGGVKPVF